MVCSCDFDYFLNKKQAQSKSKTGQSTVSIRPVIKIFLVQKHAKTHQEIFKTFYVGWGLLIFICFISCQFRPDKNIFYKFIQIWSLKIFVVIYLDKLPESFS